MQEWVKNLCAVQETDLRIAKLEDQLASVPREKDQEQQKVAKAEAAVQQAHDKLVDKEKEIKSIEMEVDTLDQRQKDLEAKSTMIKDNDEYRAALHQIDGYRKKVATCEDRELQLMEEVEETREELARRKKECEATKKRVQQMVDDLDNRLNQCEAEIEKLREKRLALMKDVPANAAAKYERIIANRRSTGTVPRAFAPVRNYTCGGCHMNVPPQVCMDARKGQVVSCPQCGVLLYTEE